MATGSRSKNRTTKAEQSRATRVRIVAAATDLFVRDGFVTTTMASIAREAGVAVQTLYLSFGNKTAILQAAFDEALRGTIEDDIRDQDWFVRVLEDPDGVAALRLFCTRSAELITRAAPVYDVMRSSSADPEVGEMLARNKKLRYDGFRTVVDAIASRDGFNPDLTATDALGILYGVLSEDGHLLMVAEHGWTSARWLTWVEETLVHQLFPGAAR